MNRPQPWLEELLEELLQLANGWCRDRAEETDHTVQSAADRKWAGVYEDNGSCLDIIDHTPPELNRRLQVLQVCNVSLLTGSPPS
jgi:hypothetical protein